MEYFVFMIVLCLGLLCQNGLSEKLPTQEKLVVEKNFNSDKEAYNQENHVLEDPFPNNADCRCTNGKCEIENGKEVCKCNPGYGYLAISYCKACECGPNQGCKWKSTGWIGSEQTCFCNPGYFEDNGKCVECDCGPEGSCGFENGMKKCTCNRGAADQGGTCTEMCIQDTDCENGGICNTETGLCICKPQTSGAKCENIEGCDPLNCLEKGAKCIYDIEKSETTCKCDDENSYYENEMCNKKCIEDTDCQNGGECNSETGFCNCKPQTSGRKCEYIEDCDAINCIEKIAKCIYDIDKSEASCKCDDEDYYYENEKCNKKCIQDTDCKNGGECNTETGICICKPQTSGGKCENIEGCDTLNCLAIEAHCVYDIDNSETTCKCDDENSYYENEKCNIINHCSKDDDCVYPLICVNQDFGEEGHQRLVCAKKQCSKDEECKYPLKCLDEGDGKGKTCSRSPCSNDDECEYPLKCIDEGFGEGQVCSRTKCTKDEECVHPLKCVDRGYGDGQVCAHASCPRRQVCAYPLDCLNLGNGEGPVCAHKKCSKDDECTKILKCVDRGHGEGPVCAYKKCTSADECAYPLRCADQATGEGQVCARTKCTKDDECTYPLICIDQGTITEGRVCSQDYCTRDDKCVYPLKCVYQEYQGAKLCTKIKCTKDAECAYPLRCVDQGIVEGHVCEQAKCTQDNDCVYPLKCVDHGLRKGRICELTKCTKDIECAYPLRCVVQEFGEGHVCAHTKCNNDDECEYPLKCVDQDVRGRNVCAHKKCTKDGECAYPLGCVEKAFGEGHVCTRKQCNNDDDCQYPLKCEDRGAWEGKVCSECDCGVYGSCTFIGRRKKCICSPATHEKDGKCVECDCGPHGLCIFEFGQKKCVCSPYSTEKDGKCIVTQTSTLVTTDSSSLMTAILTSTVSTCYCGPETKACYLDSSGNKNCSCFSGYVPINGYCAECNCGPYGTCSFEYGLKKCNCRSFATETNGVCVEMLSSSSKGTTDSFITSTILSSTVQECDCGPRGRCDVEFGRRKCICDLLTAEKDGKCVDCNCGVNSKACSFDWKGDKVCNCYSGYAEVYGFCLECNCGANSLSCSYRRNGTRICKCDFGYIHTNGYCAAICSEGTCVHGKCEVIGNDFKCRCSEGYTGHRCDENIETKYNKQELWQILQVSLMFAIFILLSGVLCFISCKRKSKK